MMNPDEPLKVTHDVSQSLQRKLEGMLCFYVVYSDSLTMI